MNPAVLTIQAASAVFAVLFIAYYVRILARAQDAGPEPVSWIVAAVGLSLVASFAVLETILTVRPVDVVFNVQRVYFMLGNIIIAGVLYRIWRNVGGNDGW
ncbi:MAG: hypothetical protein SVW02_02345 [Candidatus Nanohaloarchaea archaeon]|nr:hypothetical protein [Candidatus Nanohaloarchaea archaeon]